VDDRFCHPDACKAQIALDNVPSRHREKLERESEREILFFKNALQFACR
jgi:hypothetical protein